jgi:limonene-1,2-epoxide hydrolase
MPRDSFPLSKTWRTGSFEGDRGPFIQKVRMRMALGCESIALAIRSGGAYVLTRRLDQERDGKRGRAEIPVGGPRAGC